MLEKRPISEPSAYALKMAILRKKQLKAYFITQIARGTQKYMEMLKEIVYLAVWAAKETPLI